jgi:C-terminal processing protease CtpA/Prc
MHHSTAPHRAPITEPRLGLLQGPLGLSLDMTAGTPRVVAVERGSPAALKKVQVRPIAANDAHQMT